MRIYRQRPWPVQWVLIDESEMEDLDLYLSLTAHMVYRPLRKCAVVHLNDNHPKGGVGWDDRWLLGRRPRAYRIYEAHMEQRMLILEHCSLLESAKVWAVHLGRKVRSFFQTPTLL